MAKKKEVMMENAPDWYGTHLDKLDFEWSKEEALELERYCEKIHKNATEEEMLPIDRWKAHMFAKRDDFKNADRKMVACGHAVVYSTRTLDSYADALKPVDLYKNPKLLVKGMLASVARFKLDYGQWANVCYTEDLWGGRSKMIDYGNPCPKGEPPVKTMKDVEKLEIPDPYSDGTYPGYLWSNREMRRIIDKYKLPLPHWTSMCPGPTEVVQLGMMGWTGFQVNLKKDPEMVKAATAKASIWCKRFGEALIDVSHPEGIYCCQFTGGFHLRPKNEWVCETWVDLGKHLKAYSMKKSKYKIPGRPDGWVHLSHGYSMLSGIYEWYEVMNQHGAWTDEMWDGGCDGDTESSNCDAAEVIRWHHKYNTFVFLSILNKTLEEGPIPAIEAAVQRLQELGKYHRKFAQNVYPIYFCPQSHVDAGLAVAKKYSKLP